MPSDMFLAHPRIGRSAGHRPATSRIWTTTVAKRRQVNQESSGFADAATVSGDRNKLINRGPRWVMGSGPTVTVRVIAMMNWPWTR